MSEIETRELVLLSHWASYLINGDSSGMDAAEIHECDCVVQQFAAGGWHITLANDAEEEFRWCNDVNRRGGNVLTFTLVRNARR